MERFVSYGRRAFVILAVLALGAGVGAGSAWTFVAAGPSLQPSHPIAHGSLPLSIR